MNLDYYELVCNIMNEIEKEIFLEMKNMIDKIGDIKFRNNLLEKILKNKNDFNLKKIFFKDIENLLIKINNSNEKFPYKLIEELIFKFNEIKIEIKTEKEVWKKIKNINENKKVKFNKTLSKFFYNKLTEYEKQINSEFLLKLAIKEIYNLLIKKKEKYRNVKFIKNILIFLNNDMDKKYQENLMENLILKTLGENKLKHE